MFRKTRLSFVLLLVICSSAFLQSSLSVADPTMEKGELQYGTYSGYLALPDRKEKIALTADFFLESPEDLTQFPKLISILKLSLGGYSSSEYASEVFKNIRYDFDGGALTFDESQNNLVITSQIFSVGSKSIIKGDVWIRSSGVFGVVYLEHSSSEPGEPGEDPPQPSPPDDSTESKYPFVSTLSGQYDGRCGSEKAILQIQVQPGLIEEGQELTGGLLKDYGITARLGLDQPRFCSIPGEKVYCTYNEYLGGSYDFFAGRVQLAGAASGVTDCEFNSTGLSCGIRIQGSTMQCNFTAKSPVSSEFKPYPRKFKVSATPDQKKELPAASPPANTALKAALGGTFTGYLHHETSDKYQFVKLAVIPTSSTDNPHNPNQMFISGSVIRYFGKAASSDFLIEQFSSRSFYLRPGFILGSESADTFIAIDEWKTGYIRGTWYSHRFGKVGTLELVKGQATPISTQANLILPFSGEYEKTMNVSRTSRIKRWIKFIVPPNPIKNSSYVASLIGSYQSLVGADPVRSIEKATYDPYTESIGWILESDRQSTFSTAEINRNGNLLIYWPPGPGITMAVMRDYEPQEFFKLTR